uniref:collagen alpha-1(XII) chain-like n=1 Tax=Styela clava TaxID=7725 RepID=UPI0019395727|nr:collagen alpha-1(XII) chain-like [Styela clava]
MMTISGIVRVFFSFINPALVFSASYCKPLEELNHGKVHCSNTYPSIGSSCDFECNKGFELIPAENNEITCSKNGDWTKEKPCCRGCSTNFEKDVVIVIDSSLSMDTDKYSIMKNSVANVVGSMKNTEVQFSLVRFASQVYEKDSIFFSSYIKNSSKMQGAIRKLDGPDGRTFLGAALTYTKEVILTEENGNRKNIDDMVWVLTDGASSDIVEKPAKALRDDGVEIFALGIRQKGKTRLSTEQLVFITGKAKNVIEIKEITQLKNALRKTITRKKCDYTCQKREPPVCPPLPELPNGEVTCSSEKAIKGTHCVFTCNRGFTLLPAWKNRTECDATAGGEVEWTEKLPCCGTEYCTTDTEKDIIIVMDSSGSIKENQYEIMKTFIANTIQSFEGNKVQFALIRFGSRVFAEDTIYFGNKTSLLQTIAGLNETGGRTFLGAALDYAITNVLYHKSNRPSVKDMIWVITDGAASDEVKVPAETLRQEGAEILALGIKQPRKSQISVDELIEITGKKENVIEVDGMSNLDDQLRTKIIRKICELSCEEE